MPVVAVVGNKGGAGKTTLSINLACGLHRYRDTVLLDADMQHSSLQWRNIAGRDDLVEVIDAVDDVQAAVHEYRDRHDNVVIDCPPSVHSEQTWQSLTHCDLAIIPILPSPLDLWASVHVEREIESARKENPSLRALLVINQLEPRTRLSKLMHDALAEISLPVAATSIKRRVVYRNAMIRGCSVMQLGAEGREASEELVQLIDEVVKLT